MTVERLSQCLLLVVLVVSVPLVICGDEEAGTGSLEGAIMAAEDMEASSSGGVASGEAGEATVSCYDCMQTDPRCAMEPFKPDGIQQLDSCKTCAKFTSAEGVMRKCITYEMGVSNNCTESDSGKTCYCNSDMCNPATNIHLESSSWVLLASVCVPLLAIWWQRTEP